MSFPFEKPIYSPLSPSTLRHTCFLGYTYSLLVPCPCTLPVYYIIPLPPKRRKYKQDRMRHRSSCRVVINPIFGNATIKKIITSRGSQLERRRKYVLFFHSLILSFFMHPLYFHVLSIWSHYLLTSYVGDHDICRATHHIFFYVFKKTSY